MFIDTRSSKLCHFFFQYFVNYNKPVLLMGPYQNGLTTMCNQLRSKYMEYQNYTSFNLAVYNNMSVSQFQMRVEMNLIFKTDNRIVAPNNRPCIIQVDDLNLLPV